MSITIIGTNARGQQVTVEVEGESTTIGTKGFTGRACQLATQSLEAALGTRVSDTPTGEAYARGPEQKVGQR